MTDDPVIVRAIYYDRFIERINKHKRRDTSIPCPYLAGHTVPWTNYPWWDSRLPSIADILKARRKLCRMLPVVITEGRDGDNETQSQT